MAQWRKSASLPQLSRSPIPMNKKGRPEASPTSTFTQKLLRLLNRLSLNLLRLIPHLHLDLLRLSLRLLRQRNRQDTRIHRSRHALRINRLRQREASHKAAEAALD